MKKLRRITRDVDPETGDVRYFKPGTSARYDAIVAAGDHSCQHQPPPSKARKAHRRRRRKQHYDGCPPRPLFHTRVADINLNERRLIREEVFADAGHRCQQCGARWPLTLDHIIPLSRGGGWHKENLACLCKSCNEAKDDKMPYELAA